MEIVIQNGLIVDGTGEPAYTGDVLISGDRIVAVGTALPCGETKVIDARGKVVIPGLIDPHVHEEWICLVDGTYELFLRQGVTTVVNGNCGHSIVPGPTQKNIEYYYGNGLMSERQRAEYKARFAQWQDFNGYAAAVENAGTNLNLCTLLGHGTIRWSVMGGAFARDPSPEEQAEMNKILETNLSQGAFGLSFGLDYVPGRYATTDELAGFAKVVAGHRGVVAAHLRHALGVAEATEEFMEVGRRSGAKLQVSHLKTSCPKAFDVALSYARGGGKVLIDTIPATTAHCQSKDRALLFMMSTCDELFDQGLEGIKRAIKTPEGRALLRKDPYFVDRDQTLNTLWMTNDPALEGKSIAELAEAAGQDPKEYLLDLLAGEKDFVLWCGGTGRKDFAMEGHVAGIRQNPYVCAGSDEILGDPELPYDWYELLRRGAMPNFIQGYLKMGMPLTEIIRRNTSMVADHFDIRDRGRLLPGQYADVAVIDLSRYAFPSDTEISPTRPLAMANGVEQLFINGAQAVENGQVQKPMAGRVLRHPE